MYAFVEHVEQQLDDGDADTGVAHRQRVGADDEHGADDGWGQIWPDADGVAADEVDLQLAHVVGGDDFAFEVAEAGGDAVGDAAFGDKLLDGGAGFFDFGDGGGVELDGTAVGDGYDIINF